MTVLGRDPKNIGNAIRRKRRQLGWSQAELGARSALRQATISDVERGNPALRLDTLLTILATLDLEIQIAPRTKSSQKEFEDLLGLNDFEDLL